jgi:hypothetical protein
MTLAITMASLPLSGNTFDQKEMRELSTNGRAAVPGQYHSIICDAVTGKVYIVTETKAARANAEGPGPLTAARLEPSKVVYFEYLGRKAPYPHVVCQMKDQRLSEEERRRVNEAYRAFRDLADREPVGQVPVSA